MESEREKEGKRARWKEQKRTREKETKENERKREKGLFETERKTEKQKNRKTKEESESMSCREKLRTRDQALCCAVAVAAGLLNGTSVSHHAEGSPTLIAMSTLQARMLVVI